MGGETTISGSGSWAEVVRKSKKKIKKASFSPTKFRAGSKRMTPKTTPRKIKNLNSEDLNGENPKSRSLKKRADRAAANAARYSVTRKPSSKKKPKKKMLKSVKSYGRTQKLEKFSQLPLTHCICRWDHQ